MERNVRFCVWLSLDAWDIDRTIPLIWIPLIARSFFMNGFESLDGPVVFVEFDMGGVLWNLTYKLPRWIHAIPVMPPWNEIRRNCFPIICIPIRKNGFDVSQVVAGHCLCLNPWINKAFRNLSALAIFHSDKLSVSVVYQLSFRIFLPMSRAPFQYKDRLSQEWGFPC